MSEKPNQFFKISQLSQEDLGRLVHLPNPGLRSYLRHVELGSSDDYRTPFAGGAPREQVLSEWDKVFQALHVKERFPGLYNFEIEMREKVGPLSVQVPLKDRLKDVEQYWVAANPPHADPISAVAIREAARKLCAGKVRSVRLRNPQNTVEKMRLSTNAGLPYFIRRRVVVDDSLRMAEDLLNGVSERPIAAVLGWRGQEHGPEPKDTKQRVVWMFPFHVNIAELSAYQPLVEMCQHTLSVPAYVSMESVDREITALFTTKDPDDLVMCSDFTAFDQHFGPVMQDGAHDVLRYLLTPNGSCWDWFKHVFRVKYHLPLLLSETTIAESREAGGVHGMGSGSGGTNFDEVCAHTALQYEAANRVHAKLNPHSMAYGDDGILSYPGLKSDDVISSYTSHGLEMNPEKQMLDKQDCVFLRRWHSMRYRDKQGVMVGVYSTYRALGRLLGQERYYDPDKWDREMVEIRYLSILENCKYSPYFHEFVDFCASKDKYRLGLDLPGFLDGISRYGERATRAFGDDFIGYTRSLQRADYLTGMSQWEVVKYLKSKQH